MNRESNNSSNNGIPVELMLHNSWLKIRNNNQTACYGHVVMPSSFCLCHVVITSLNY